MKGILFNAEMVRAILDGRKTVTRRMIKPQPTENVEEIHGVWCEQWDVDRGDGYVDQDARPLRSPYLPGEIVYVKETWMGTRDCLSYKASDPRQIIEFNYDRWHPSIHMPEWASRIHLEIISVRPERVQEITEEEAMREGVNWQDNAGLARFTARKMFITLWGSIHPGSWDQNSWVWRVEFKVAKETP